VLSLRALLEARQALPADFAPDAGSILVLSNLTGTMQLYRVPGSGGSLEQLTDFDEPVYGTYLPGGDRLLVAIDQGGNERHQLYLLDAEPQAELEPLVVEPEFLHIGPEISRDGRLLVYGCNRRNGVDLDVYVRELASGEERCVFALGGWCSPAGFSPDGGLVAVFRLTERSSDNDVYLVDVETGEAIHVSPHEDEAYFGPPAWLPGGKSFLFSTNHDRDLRAIARYDLDSRSWEYVLDDSWDLDCATDWTGGTLLVEANEEGYTRLELLDPETLALRAEVELPGRGVALSPAFSRDGRSLAYQFTSPVEPGDVWLCETESGKSRRLTESPFGVDRARLVEPELHRFESFDGESVPVFLYGSGNGPAPVMVDIHGGPEAQRRPVFFALGQYFASRGFAVASPNVRGSTGYGKRYEHLDDRAQRLDSVRDLAALHSWLAARSDVDPERVALYGGSYGGYMVLAGLAFHAELWAAGISVVGISSFVTFLENTAAWRRAFREREYGSLEHDRELLTEISPLTHVDRLRVPLFLIHGANDPRVPLSEAEQIHRALTERGIACELLVYGDEGHGLQKLKNRLDAYPKAAEFLERVLDS
jgi:dipeptidyl aminopeptidase/acylaminoacyl peptidase